MLFSHVMLNANVICSY